ncbi:RNase adapter RapZ [Oceanotoga sp. DSM 15011]|jgi:UPF0042 nucleotide-binding protein|uniref:UPF0042 nucleotide-binding protein n=1 Tax=Oceanotoga teriensis TaxID=515440 RepID=A0AA45HJB6_9BACT|nr:MULTISPECIES: RNase adapter RapZ [Oceanotoga]MDN5342353.1 RNase adapter protein RapZ [Oceanotoga sp.]PWJ95826.1 UPF0042 nucleotide-binding protein [Oceanotoga teriensis]UYP00944.1 RNase adapter RapZ [Oceanotoga sp. DSM 15011]
MDTKPRIFIITGLSGAGKTFLLKTLEDENYYTVDNVPPHLINSFLDVIRTSNVRKLALVSDLRWKNPQELVNSFLSIENNAPENMEIKKVFLEADNQTLMNRFRKSRRSHPLGTPVLEAIEKERKLLNEIKNISDIIMDTSNTEPYEFRKNFLMRINEGKRTLKMNIMSFGFKHGIPEYSDYIYDVRYLPNPYYFTDMYKLTGLDEKVRIYLEEFEQTHKTVQILEEAIEIIMKEYTESGRVEAYFCVGCTGGKHRSVYVAQRIYDEMKKRGFDVILQHRDIDKE